MTEDQILLSSIKDKINQAYEKNYPTFSQFLDMRQASLVRNAVKYEKNVQVWFYGGYDEAERVIALFLPDYLYCDTEEEMKEAVFSDDSAPFRFFTQKRIIFTP